MSKNLLSVNEHTGRVTYLGPTLADKTHDKKAAHEADLSFRAGAKLSKVSKGLGFQGHEPSACSPISRKSPKAKL